jgi:hypothetical protein
VSEDYITRDLVRDLHQVRPTHYWKDLLTSALLGWSGFALSVILRPFSPAMMAAVAVAIIGLYRGLCFVHEISHQNARVLPGFETAWNLLIGYSLSIPSFVPMGIHSDHYFPGFPITTFARHGFGSLALCLLALTTTRCKVPALPIA